MEIAQFDQCVYNKNKVNCLTVDDRRKIFGKAEINKYLKHAEKCVSCKNILIIRELFNATLKITRSE